MKILLYLTLLLVLSGMLTACTPAKKETNLESPAEYSTPSLTSKITKTTVPDIKKTKPGYDAVQAVRPDAEVESKGVIVLVSGKSPSYMKLANLIIAQSSVPFTRHIMSTQPAKNRVLLNDINASNKPYVIAVGLKAAKLVKQLKTKHVIFTSIVNHEDYDLVSDQMKGVSALPSPEKLFKDWKLLSPDLTTVAVIAGNNLDNYLTYAALAADKYGIELVVRKVSTDKEFIYKSKHLSMDVQGQWILPDNRVLSSKALKDVMSYASRRGRQIVVFGPKLLAFGGLFYVVADEKIVSEKVFELMKDKGDSVNGIAYVMNHRMGVNARIARQLNLEIPDDYREFIYGK